MASSKAVATTALLLSFNLLFFTLVTSTSCPPEPKTPKHPPKSSPPSTKPPSTAYCPRDALKLGVCANVLKNLLNVVIGTPPKTPCCPLLDGLVDLEAAACLCTAIKANVLVLKGIRIAVAESLALIEVEQNSRKVGNLENMSWEKPDTNWCKVNCDAAFDDKNKEACLRVVIRNDAAELVGGKAVKHAAVSSLIAESLAVREGLREAQRMKIPKVIVESDSQTLVNNVLAKGESRWEIEPIVKDIRAFMGMFHGDV
ncbi:hypothetical protein CCACVL1_25583 [Corchorus capsularis]|uniref:Bifunctional inhibitor/plant lipid transfer protein/seed storage helical domain-containing protein n=1 Tax=Corchorus capsularis TaxID=210143 RepID=A0A1R3GJ62_COCAP|nr:hypothetical protein CCACVL1_25583 [Corchorus capsularis]